MGVTGGWGRVFGREEALGNLSETREARKMHLVNNFEI